MPMTTTMTITTTCIICARLDVGLSFGCGGGSGLRSQLSPSITRGNPKVSQQLLQKPVVLLDYAANLLIKLKHSIRQSV